MPNEIDPTATNPSATHPAATIGNTEDATAANEEYAKKIAEFFRFITLCINLSSPSYRDHTSTASEKQSLKLGVNERFIIIISTENSQNDNKILNVSEFKRRLIETKMYEQLKTLKTRLSDLLQSVKDGRKNISTQPLLSLLRSLKDSGIFSTSYIENYINPTIDLVSNIPNLKEVLNDTSLLTTIEDIQAGFVMNTTSAIPLMRTGDYEGTYKKQKTVSADTYRTLASQFADSALNASENKNFTIEIECLKQAINTLKQIDVSERTEDDTDNIIIFIHQLGDAYYQLAESIEDLSQVHVLSEEQIKINNKNGRINLINAIEAINDIKDFRPLEGEEHFSIIRYCSKIGASFLQDNNYESAVYYYLAAVNLIVKEYKSDNSSVLDSLDEIKYDIIQNFLIAKLELIEVENNTGNLKDQEFLLRIIDFFNLDQIDPEEEDKSDIIPQIKAISLKMFLFVLDECKKAIETLEQDGLDEVIAKLSQTQFGIAAILKALHVTLMHGYEITNEVYLKLNRIFEFYKNKELSPENVETLKNLKVEFFELRKAQRSSKAISFSTSSSSHSLFSPEAEATGNASKIDNVNNNATNKEGKEEEDDNNNEEMDKLFGKQM